jgi:alpha-beta hydrolase superfamily lysophospholipase
MPKSTRGNRSRTALKWVLWILLFQFILINISASLHAWKQTHFYSDPGLRIVRPSSKNIFTKTWKLFAGFKYPKSVVRQIPGFPIDTVRFKSKNGINIDCWYSRPDSQAKGTVILFHGLSGNKSYILQEASQFRLWGYNIMMVDLRGHGNSGGNMTTIGFKETEEAKLAYDYVQQKGEKNIFLWGISMGAIIIAKAFKDYDIHPAGVILEMPVASLQSFLEARSRVLGFPEEPFGFFVTAWIGIERGYNGFGFRPAEYVRKLNCPVLLQWGSKDPYVSKDQIEKIFSNIESANKKLVIYNNADHQSLLGFDPEKWKEEVSALLKNPQSVHSWLK